MNAELRRNAKILAGVVVATLACGSAVALALWWLLRHCSHGVVAGFLIALLILTAADLVAAIISASRIHREDEGRVSQGWLREHGGTDDHS